MTANATTLSQLESHLGSCKYSPGRRSNRGPDSGKYRRTRLFVLTLGNSRKSVRLLVFSSNSQTWAELA